MTDPRSLHATHDPLAIAALVADDVTGTDGARATATTLTCRECAALHADLVAIAAATRDLPAPVIPRMFTISQPDADRLRRRGWRAVLHRLAGPRFALAQPLGAAFATLGVAGFLLTSVPAMQLTGTPRASSAEVGAAASSAAPQQPAGQGGVTQVDQVRSGQGESSGSGGAPNGELPGGGFDREGEDLAAADPDPGTLAQRSGDATLAILSGSFAIVGVGLFGLRWTARRLDDG